MAFPHRHTPQFGGNKPGTPGAPAQCAECEAMLADALDGTLSAQDRQRFDSHMLSCNGCAEMLADAQRGAAWLEMLRDPRPEPPAFLVERILQRTESEAAQPVGSVQAGQPIPVPVMPYPFVPARNLVVFPGRGRSVLQSLHHTLLQPRLAMTAAMAFFSIGLTLNLTGVQLNQLNTRGLKPSNVRQSFYQTNARIVRYYDNLRVVYELESRVRELQRGGDSETPQPAKEPETEPNPPQKHATPRSSTGGGHRPTRPSAATPSILARLDLHPITIQKGEPA